MSRGQNDSDAANGRRTRVFWGRSEMDKLLTWIEQNKPDCIGHGRREDCARIKSEVFAQRSDYTPKTIKEKLLNMEKKFKKAQELRFNTSSDLSVEGSNIEEKLEKLCPFYTRIERLKRMNPTPSRPVSNRGPYMSPPSSSTAPESSGMIGRMGGESASSAGSTARPSTQGSAYSQYYPMESGYAQEEEEEDPSSTAHQINQLMRTSGSQSNAQDNMAASQQSARNSQSNRRYTHVPPNQGQRHSPGLPSQQRRLPPFSPTMQAPSHTSQQLVRASTSTTGAAAQPRNSSTSLAAATASGPLDFHKLISVLERRERRLEAEAAERLELEKRRFEYTELMEQKRLEIEQARFQSEKERTARIENILMSLVARGAGVNNPQLASVLVGEEGSSSAAESGIASNISS